MLAQRPLVEFTLAPLWQDHGIPLAIMGILVVFLALVLVVTFITLLPRALALLDGNQSRSHPALGAGDELSDELSEEMLAVIAAAVAATVGQPHRIVRIRGMTPADLGWSLEGRMHHHQSHRIHRRDRR